MCVIYLLAGHVYTDDDDLELNLIELSRIDSKYYPFHLALL